jgi:hypothetical protein
MQHFITRKGFLFHLNSHHPGMTESLHDHLKSRILPTQAPSITITSVETPLHSIPFARSSNNEDDPLVSSAKQCNDYFDFCEGADESVCAGPINNNNKHATVSFHRVLKYSNQKTASSNASCSSQDVEEEFENSSLQKPLNINGCSKERCGRN